MGRCAPLVCLVRHYGTNTLKITLHHFSEKYLHKKTPAQQAKSNFLMLSVIPADVNTRDRASVTSSHAGPALQGLHTAWEVTWILELVLHQLKCLISCYYQHLYNATNCTVIAQVSPGTPPGTREAVLLTAEQLLTVGMLHGEAKGQAALLCWRGRLQQGAAPSQKFSPNSWAPDTREPPGSKICRG